MLEELLIHQPTDPLDFLIAHLSKKTEVITNIVIGSFSENEILELNYSKEEAVKSFPLQSSASSEEPTKKVFFLNIENYGNPKFDLKKILSKLQNLDSEFPDVKVFYIFNLLRDINDVFMIRNLKINYHQMFYFQSRKDDPATKRNYSQLINYFESVITYPFDKRQAVTLLKVQLTRPFLGSTCTSKSGSSISSASPAQVEFIIPDLRSCEAVRKMARLMGLVYVDLPLLLSYERSDASREYAHRVEIKTNEILYLLKRFVSKEKCRLNGFCFNIDYIVDSEHLMEVFHFNVPNTQVPFDRYCLSNWGVLII